MEVVDRWLVAGLQGSRVTRLQGCGKNAMTRKLCKTLIYNYLLYNPATLKPWNH